MSFEANCRMQPDRQMSAARFARRRSGAPKTDVVTKDLVSEVAPTAPDLLAEHKGDSPNAPNRNWIPSDHDIISRKSTFSTVSAKLRRLTKSRTRQLSHGNPRWTSTA